MNHSLKLFLVASFVSCGSKPVETIFTSENAWSDSMPSEATLIEPDEFRALVASGELRIESTASLSARNTELQKQYEDNKAFLHTIPNKSPYLQALLDEADKQPVRDGDRITSTNDGQVVFGIATQIDEAVEVIGRSQNAKNAIADYTLSYELLPASLRSKVSAATELTGKTAAEIGQELGKLNAALNGHSSLKSARPMSGSSAVRTLKSGNGTERAGACTPTNYFAKYWFPLKNFVSEVKNQGRRGTCWAFTALGAIESRELVQNDNATDLSEQFLVNKVKAEWDSSNYIDGAFSEKALDTAVNKGQVFPPESSWTYNPAYGRPTVEKNEASYADTCTKSIAVPGQTNRGPYTGTCSNTSHQSERFCSTFGVTVCGYQTATFAGPGIASSRTIQLWPKFLGFADLGFDLNRYRNYLNAGHVIMASFPVYRGFMNDVAGAGADGGVAGVVHNYSPTSFQNGNEVIGPNGAHAVQIVGFLSNELLTGTSSIPVNVGGGGYFIIKNSWGCSGDSGYYYVPADYVRRFFTSLSILEFDTRRSQAWSQEQALPGGSIAPSIQITSTALSADLRVGVELTRAFTVTHPVSKSVNLTITSDKDGQLYSGAWSTDPTSLNFSTFKHAFASVGLRTIRLVASFGGRDSRETFKVDAFNTNPSVRIDFNGTPHQGEPFSLTANMMDINETNATTLCANAIWTVTAPDVLSATSGCQVKVTFGATGSRRVSVTTRDSEGLPASNSEGMRVFSVLPPLANPYPRIVDFGVNSSELNGFGCYSVNVPSGSTIDLRENGCALGALPKPSHYFAAVALENPSNETLTFDWSLIYTGNSGDFLGGSSHDRTFQLDRRTDGLNAVILPCRVVVKVNAPEASRSKMQTVWLGNCTYDPLIH
jgi:hypothetical protein